MNLTMNATFFTDTCMQALSAMRNRACPVRGSRQLRPASSTVRVTKRRDVRPWPAAGTYNPAQPTPETAPSSAHDGADAYGSPPQSP